MLLWGGQPHVSAASTLDGVASADQVKKALRFADIIRAIVQNRRPPPGRPIPGRLGAVAELGAQPVGLRHGVQGIEPTLAFALRIDLPDFGQEVVAPGGEEFEGVAQSHERRAVLGRQRLGTAAEQRAHEAEIESEPIEAHHQRLALDQVAHRPLQRVDVEPMNAAVLGVPVTAHAEAECDLIVPANGCVAIGASARPVRPPLLARQATVAAVVGAMQSLQV